MDCRDARDIEVHAIGARIGEVGEEIKLLFDVGRCTKLMGKIVTEQQLRGGSIQPRGEEFAIGGGPRPEIELGGLGRDGVISGAAGGC